MSRRKSTATTCAQPGCEAEREWCKRRGEYRSRYCAVHRRQRGAQRSTAPLPVRQTEPLTPRYVLNEWRQDRTCTAYYDGRRVYGIQQDGDGFRVQLAGADESVRVTGQTQTRDRE